MSTRSSIKWRDETDDTPGFHLYSDCMDDGGEPPVYLQLDGVATELMTTDKGASVTVTLPRETAKALGLLSTQPAQPIDKSMVKRLATQYGLIGESAQTERALTEEQRNCLDVAIKDLAIKHSLDRTAAGGWIFENHELFKFAYAVLAAQPASGADHD